MDQKNFYIGIGGASCYSHWLEPQAKILTRFSGEYVFAIYYRATYGAVGQKLSTQLSFTIIFKQESPKVFLASISIQIVKSNIIPTLLKPASDFVSR